MLMLDHQPIACARPQFQKLIRVFLSTLIVSLVMLERFADAQLLVQAPATTVEGAGTLTNAGKVGLTAVASSNVVVSVTSSDPASVVVPASVTILSGQSNSVFNLQVPDNVVMEGNRTVTLSAVAAGYNPASTNILVLDNDPHHIRFSPVSTLTDTNNAMGFSLFAENADGSVQTNFNGEVNFIAQGIDGPLPFEPTNSVTFIQGKRFASFRLTVPGRGVRMLSIEYPGQSDAFNVVLPAFYSNNQMVGDILWLQNSQTLLASVPAAGGVYANRLVAIDPANGTVTNFYAVGFDPGAIEPSPEGTYAYLTLSNRAAMQRFDLNTMTAGLQFPVSTDINPSRVAYDFCVPPGLSDAVVVAARDGTFPVGIWRYSSGVPTQLDGLTATTAYRVESLTNGNEIAIFPPLARGDAVTGNVLSTGTNFPGSSAVYKQGRLYDDTGHSYLVPSLGLFASYPGVITNGISTAVVETDSDLRRVFFLVGYGNFGTTFFNLKTYDRDLLQLLSILPMPGTPAPPTRVMRLGTNGLAYVTGNGQLWFVRPEAIQPSAPPAEISLSLSNSTSIATLGADYSFTLTVTNAGPGIASVVSVTNSFPANVTLVSAVLSFGTIFATNNGFTWNLSGLAPGSNVTLSVVVRFGSGGWQTNNTWALGFESDPVFSNNTVTLPVYVQLSPTTLGAFAVNYSSEDIIYDRVRDRLLLSVGNSPGSGQTNGLAVFNPYVGTVDSFTSLGKRPSVLAASYGGEYLYISFPEDGLVRRTDLPGLTQNLEFGLGGEFVNGLWHPYYGADLAVLPGAASSLAAWRVRRAGPQAGEFGRGIAVFDDAIMRSNVTSSGGSWRLEFETNQGNLFAFSSGDLRRCAITSAGVEFAETYPQLFSAGNNVLYGRGKLFTTGGRLLQYNPFQVAWLFPGAEPATLAAPDPTFPRVFYLVQTNGWQIKTYDTDSRKLLGSITLTNLAGTPSSLVRWGTNGLALRTTSNQLYVVRSPLIQPLDNADVALRLDGPGPQVPMGSNAVFTLTLSNSGPSAATNLQITNSFSPSVAVVTISASAGTSSASPAQIAWQIPILQPGSQETLTYTIRGSQTGMLTVVASVVSSAPDINLPNNTAVQELQIGTQAVFNSASLLQIPANDLVWSPSAGRLLLTAAKTLPNWAGTLFSINPITWAIKSEAVLGIDANRVAISASDAVLFAGADYGVNQISLTNVSVVNRFLVNPLDIRGVATDLKVVVGADNSLAVCSKSPTGNSSWISAYDSGSPRATIPSFFSASTSLLFGTDPGVIYSAEAGGNFNRYTLDSQGVSLLDSATGLVPSTTPAAQMDWGDGAVYSSLGTIINPLSRTLVGTIAGIPAGSLVKYEPGCTRLFFLSPATNQAVLRAFDAPTLLPIGTTVIPGIQGSLNNLSRWGTDGFAVTTSSNQVAIFRSTLIATNAPADLAVKLAHGPGPYFSGSNVTAVVTMTNAGPNSAQDVTWNESLPVGTVILGATGSLGGFTIASNTISGLIPILAAGSNATISVTFVAPATGVVTNQVAAVASSIDPFFSNNVASALLWVLPPSGLQPLQTINLAVRDIEKDPVRPLIYASLGSNAGLLGDSIVVIDPQGGSISPPTRVGSNPGRLAASPNGQFLYVALDGAGSIQKLTLPGLSLVSSFPIPGNQIASRMVVSPDDPETVVVRRTPAGRTSLHVAGVQRPGELIDQDLFAFSEASGLLFGCRSSVSNVKMYHLNGGVTGLSLLEDQPCRQNGATDLKSSGGLFFFDRGMVVNPDTRTVRSTMPVPIGSVVEPDTSSGRAYYATAVGASWALKAFDIGQAIEVASVPIPGLLSPPRRLIRWGNSGLALYTTNAQLVITRGLLVPTNPPVEMILGQSISTNSVTTNETITLFLSLTNAGPSVASHVIVTQSFSLAVTNVTLNAGMGSATFFAGVVTWQAGDFAKGAASSLTVSVRPTQIGTLTVAAAAYHDENDPFWGNNVALNVVNVGASSNIDSIVINFSTRDLSYDPVHDVIYASTPASSRLFGNLVAFLNPVMGAIQQALPAGSEPNCLAASADGGFLFASLDGAMSVQPFSLPSGIPLSRFQLGTNDLYLAQDLEVHPIQPQMVASSLTSYNFAPGFPSSVVVYDTGVPLANAGNGSRGIVFSEDGGYLFGFASPGTGSGVVKMRLSNSGIPVTEYLPAFASPPSELKFSNGRLYSNSGEVIDPFVPLSLGSNSAVGPLAIDRATGQAVYLAQRGTNWELRTFGVSAFQATGTQTVSNVAGTPANLVLCGKGRVAFRTSSNQVFIIRSPLISTNPLAPCNLSLRQQATQDFSTATETLRFAMVVSNQGPATASNVLLSIRPPSPVDSILVQVPQGSLTTNHGYYLCNLGQLAAGQSVQVSLSSTITNTQTFTNFASVSSATPDLAPSDNTSSTNINGLFFQRTDSVRKFGVIAQCLAYDPVHSMLYAALAPNGGSHQIARFDPETGSLNGTLTAAFTPELMRVTDDGQYLYMSSSYTGLVQRVRLADTSIDMSFTPGDATAVGSLATIPGHSRSIALTYWQTLPAFAAVFDDGVSRNYEVGYPFSILTCSSDGTQLFGYANTGTGGNSPDVFRMSLGLGGVTGPDNGPSDQPSLFQTEMSYRFGKLFFGSGAVMNPSPWSVEPDFPVGGISMDHVAGTNLVGFLTADPINGSVAHALIFNYPGRQQLAKFDFNLSPGPFASLTWCGADRFAFRTPMEIVFFRSSAIASSDLLLSGSQATTQVRVGDFISLQVVASNAGPSSVSGVWVTNTLPIGVDVVGASVSQGSLSTNNQNLIANVGTLPSNSFATLNLVLSPSAQSVGWATNSTHVISASPPDPLLHNNHIMQSFLVLPFGPPVITGFGLDGNGHLQLSFGGVHGGTYSLQASTNLIDWVELTNWTLSASCSCQIVDPTEPITLKYRFYRLGMR
jgi:uncharacterized repeat protein (TIGR01451 family)